MYYSLGYWDWFGIGPTLLVIGVQLLAATITVIYLLLRIRGRRIDGPVCPKCGYTIRPATTPQ